MDYETLTLKKSWYYNPFCIFVKWKQKNVQFVK
jgi:hypothetical protein